MYKDELSNLERKFVQPEAAVSAPLDKQQLSTIEEAQYW